MTEKNKQAFRVLEFLTLSSYLSFYYFFARFYPAYISWDMDHLTVLDLISLGSNQLPDHMAHPGVGLYILLGNLLNLISFFGDVEVYSFKTISESINPLVSLLQYLDVVRWIQSTVILMTPIVLWHSLAKLFKLDPLKRFILLCFAFSQTWVAVHFPIIRSESIAAFYYAVAMYFLAQGLTSSSDRRKYLWVFACGLGIGLAFLTKIQAIIYLPLVVLTALIWLNIHNQKFEIQTELFRKIVKASVVVLGMLFLVSFFSLAPNIASFRHKFWLPSIFLVFFAGCCFCLLKISKNRKTNVNFAAPIADISALIFCGFLFAFFAALLIPLGFENRVQYFVATAKIILKGTVDSHIVSAFSLFDGRRLLENILSSKIQLAVSLGFILLIGLKLKDFRNRIYALAIWLLALSTFLLLVRNSFRQDSVWFESAFLTGVVVSSFVLRGNLQKALYLILIFVVASINMLNSFGMLRSSTFAERDSKPFLKSVYEGNQLQWNSIVDEMTVKKTSNNDFFIGLRSVSRRIQNDIFEFDFLLGNLKVRPMRVGYMFEHVRAIDLNSYWLNVPSDLKGSVYYVFDVFVPKGAHLNNLLGMAPHFYDAASVQDAILFNYTSDLEIYIGGESGFLLNENGWNAIIDSEHSYSISTQSKSGQTSEKALYKIIPGIRLIPTNLLKDKFLVIRQ